MKKTLVLIIILSLLCSGCSYNQRKFSYYSNKDNYITVSGTVEYINYFEESIIIAFSNLSESFDDDHFKIIGQNYELVTKRGIEDHLAVHITVTFTTAPRYFGDGYIMPIVAIWIDDTMFLEFEEGYANFLQSI